MSCTAPLFLFFRNSMLLETLGWPCDRGDFAPIPRPSLLENWTSSAEVDVSPRLRLVAGELAIIFWGDQRDFNEHAAPQKTGKVCWSKSKSKSKSMLLLLLLLLLASSSMYPRQSI